MPKPQTSTKKCSKHCVVHINGGYASCPMNKKKVESLKALGFASPSTNKVVKGYAVITKRGVVVEAYKDKFDADMVIKIAESHGVEGRVKVSCTIAYSLPITKPIKHRKTK